MAPGRKRKAPGAGAMLRFMGKDSAAENENPPAPDLDLDGLNLAELKERCKATGLPVSGRKADLKARILAKLEDGTAEASASAAAAPSSKRPRRAKSKIAVAASSQATTDKEESESSPSQDDDAVELSGCLPKHREQTVRGEGMSLVMGVDEAGRGPLAGPVVTAACAMPVDISIPGINDSKQTTEEQREALYDLIVATPGVRWAVAVIDARRIDEINILKATMEGMAKCCAAIMEKKDASRPADASRSGCYVVTGSCGEAEPFRKASCYALIDGNRVPQALPCRGEALVKGDGREYIIGAASILAKVTRDRLMVQYAGMYPEYDLQQHKGYPTAGHMAAIHKHGPCPIHRRTFAPLKHMDLPNDPVKKLNPFLIAKQNGKKKSSTSKKAASVAAPKVDTTSDVAGDVDAKVSPMPRTTAASAPAAGGGAELVSLDGVDPAWRAALEDETSKKYFRDLMSFLAAEYQSRTIFPPREKVFNALRLCPLQETKVVILGQDPYHQPGQAHGLSFSVEGNIQKPPSLRNIFKELRADTGARTPNHGNLEHWASQGVLLLNTCLTVRKANANSHQRRGWESFTDAVIRKVSEERDGVVFLLWGKPAQTKASLIDVARHHIIKTSHPSPLSATRPTKTCPAFIGSKCFSQANAFLEQGGGEPINWEIP